MTTTDEFLAALRDQGEGEGIEVPWTVDDTTTHEAATGPSAESMIAEAERQTDQARGVVTVDPSLADTAKAIAAKALSEKSLKEQRAAYQAELDSLSDEPAERALRNDLSNLVANIDERLAWSDMTDEQLVDQIENAAPREAETLRFERDKIVAEYGPDSLHAQDAETKLRTARLVAFRAESELARRQTQYVSDQRIESNARNLTEQLFRDEDAEAIERLESEIATTQTPEDRAEAETALSTLKMIATRPFEDRKRYAEVYGKALAAERASFAASLSARATPAVARRDAAKVQADQDTQLEQTQLGRHVVALRRQDEAWASTRGPVVP
jgi:hypothetical protein